LIETDLGLRNVEAIAAVEGLDALYVGPSDLAIALGLKPGADGNPTFEAALARIRRAGIDAGIAVGIHCSSGRAARQRLAEGFTFAVAASDLATIVAGASAELAAAQREGTDGGPPGTTGIYGEPRGVGAAAPAPGPHEQRR
jgi:4-hydroxy-2-oxoheptanedioate aldolase